MAALIVAVLGFYLATQRQGHDWGGDFALYLMHARNIANFHPYADTPFLFEADGDIYQGPAVYPPMLPLLLAPVYRIFGLNYTALKAETTIILLLSLWPIYRLARRRFPDEFLWLLALIGLSPLWLGLRDSISSEAAYIFFSYWSLEVAERRSLGKRDGANPIRWGIATGLLCAAAYLSRTIGVALVPAILIYDLLKHRRITRFAVALSGSFALAAIIARMFTGVSQAYSGAFFVFDAKQVLLRPVEYAKFSSYMWINGFSHPYRYVCWAVLSCFALAGIARKIREGLSILELYSLFYMLALSVWVTADTRFIIPLMPIFFFWIAGGLKLLPALAPRAFTWAAATAAILLMGSSELANIVNMPRGPINDGVRDARFRAVCDFLIQQTPERAVMVSWNPRVFGLYTQRKFTTMPRRFGADEILRYLRRVGANYEVIFLNDEADARRLRAIRARPDIFREVYSNAMYRVFHIEWGISRAEFPEPQFQRELWMTLNGTWDFGFESKSSPRPINVPFAPESVLSGVHDTGFHSRMWYRRKFSVPEAWSGKRILLHFGAVNYRAHVFINGKLAGNHQGGQTPFFFDITDLLIPARNEIYLEVEGPTHDPWIARGKQARTLEPAGIFYMRTTGVWQPVWLEAVGDSYLESAQIEPSEDGWVAVSAVIRHPGAHMMVKVVATSDGYPVAGNEKVTADSRAALRFRVKDVKLWWPADPELYGCDIALYDGRKLIDSVHSYFGFRKVEARNGRVFLNNSPLMLKMVMDQGYWPDTIMTPPSDDAIKADILAAKNMGFNGVRKHQKVEDPRYLYWADKLGLLISGEIGNDFEFDAESVRQFADEWLAAVNRDSNHPSIIIWVPVNEEWGARNIARDPAQQSFVKGLYYLTHSAGGNRLVVDNDGWYHTNTTDLFTVHDYVRAEILAVRWKGLGARPDRVPDVAAPSVIPGYRYNGAPIVLSEFGGITLLPPGYPKRANMVAYMGAEYSEASALKRIRDLYAAIAEIPAVAGYSFTQLYDIEQELNGLLTFDRKPKYNPAEIRKLNDSLSARN